MYQNKYPKMIISIGIYSINRREAVYGRGGCMYIYIYALHGCIYVCVDYLHVWCACNFNSCIHLFGFICSDSLCKL